jgi:hypothetical protein
LICIYVGQIFIATPILNEIDELDENICIDLGMKLVEPDLDHVMKATERNGPLSFYDNLCLILAKEYGLTCVTNDKPLRQKCSEAGVHLIWGIELICILVESGGLPSSHAKNLILEIQKNNPKYIKDSIVQDAFKRLGLSK